MKDKPDWFPELADEKFVARIRADYEQETVDLNDAEIKRLYADGAKYSVIWDDVDEAYEYYEPLADAYLEALLADAYLEALKRLRKLDALEAAGVDNWDGYEEAMRAIAGDD